MLYIHPALFLSAHDGLLKLAIGYTLHSTISCGNEASSGTSFARIVTLKLSEPLSKSTPPAANLMTPELDSRLTLVSSPKGGICVI